MSLKEPEIIERLQKMDEYDFEQFVAELWERRGWETEVSAQSGDRGIDVIATRSAPYPEKEVIQAKRYHSSNRVGSDELQKYTGLHLQVDNADKVVLVCTSGFTDGALSVADDTNLKCVNGHTLAELVISQNAGDLVEKYTTEGTGRTPPDTRQAKSRDNSVQQGEDVSQQDFSIVERGEELDIELLGLDRVDTKLSSSSWLGESTAIDGVIAAFKMYSKESEIWISTDSHRKYIFRDEAGNEYYPASLNSGVFEGDWNAYSFGEVHIRPGGSQKVVMAVSLPGNTKVSEISVEKSRFLSSKETLKFELDFDKRERLRQLPAEIESAL